jgi:hypothetical protein
MHDDIFLMVKRDWFDRTIKSDLLYNFGHSPEPRCYLSYIDDYILTSYIEGLALALAEIFEIPPS